MAPTKKGQEVQQCSYLFLEQMYDYFHNMYEMETIFNSFTKKNKKDNKNRNDEGRKRIHIGSREGKSRLTTQDSGDNDTRTAPHYNNNNIMWPLQQNCHKFCLHDHQTIFKKSFVDIVKKKADNTKKLMEVNSKYSLFSQTNKEKQKNNIK